MRITFLAFYFGFGVLTNLMLFGPINWSSWLSWAVLLLWPALWCAVAFFAGLMTYLTVIFFAWTVDSFGQIGFVQRWNKRRMDKRIRKFLRNARNA